MKKNYFLVSLILAIFGSAIFFKWDQSRKLDRYFINQFALDYQTQVSLNQRGHGDIFEKTLEEMKSQGYNPYEIEQIMIQGFDKANQTIASQQAHKNMTKTS